MYEEVGSMVLARLTPAVAQQLALGARDVLTQGAAVLTGNQGDYIANGDPQSIYGKIQQATARQYCRRYADDPEAVPGAVGVLVENACRPYLAAIGYGTAPTLKTPYQGGQCDEIYLVTFRGVSATGALTNPFTRRVHGPLGATRSLPGGGSAQLQIECRGININASNCGALTPGTFAFRGVGLGGSSYIGGSLQVTAVVPCDGTDQCGNPPPELQPPIPPTVPGPRRERYNPGPDIDIDIDIDINPDGGFDVDFGIGPVTVAPPGGDGGGSGGGGGQPDPGVPGTPEPTGPGGDTEGEAPPNSVLVGLRVEILEFPAEPKLYADGVYRGVCYVYMGTEGLLDHDPAGAMLRADQFVYAERENLTHWRVSANNGYSLRVTPYYRELELETV